LNVHDYERACLCNELLKVESELKIRQSLICRRVANSPHTGNNWYMVEKRLDLGILTRL